MGTLRFFSGGRDNVGKKTIAQELLRFEIEKKAKLDPEGRFKFIMQRKMEESRKKVEMNKKGARPMSARAEKALKELAAKKAAKEAKALRRMVIVEPKTFINGRLTKKGDIFDIAGNKVGQVNTKDGKMNSLMGSFIGRYKPKSNRTHTIIQSAIDQHSPYFINMRKMQAMQNAGLDPRTGQPLVQDTINVHGSSSAMSAMHGGSYKPMGSEHFYNNHHHHDDGDHDLHGNGANGMTRGSSIGGSAFGVQSNNVWGNFADNAWGTSFDNVHGSNNQDVWGQATASMGKAVQMWGTGSGNNYIRSLITRLSQLFGLNTKAGRQRVAMARATSGGPRPGSGGGPRPSAGPRPSSAPAARPSAPVGRR